MDSIVLVAPLVPQAVAKQQKFKKNTSLSSVATHSDFYLEDQTACRKITIQQKQRFVELITQQNLNMKEAAKKVGISYSTAKKVYARFRGNLKAKITAERNLPQSGVRCEWACLQADSADPAAIMSISLISTIGGREQQAPTCCPSKTNN